MNKDQKLKDWFKAGIDDYGTSTDNVDKASLEIQLKPDSNGEYSVIINGINEYVKGSCKLIVVCIFSPF